MKIKNIALSLLSFIYLTACGGVTPIPATVTATRYPSHYFPPHTSDEAQEILTESEEAILKSTENLEIPLSQQYPWLYRAAFYAAWNASVYFPDDPRVSTWEWKMAYYSAMDGNGELAADIYIKKITEALNEQNMGIEDLPAWFKSGELRDEYITPHFELQTQLISLSGSDHAYLVQLGDQSEGIDVPGNLCLLIKQQETQSTVYFVYNGFAKSGFFPTLRNPSYCTMENATGDGIDEVIAHNWWGGHVGTNTLQVFDISTLPPEVLPFRSSRDQSISAWNGSDREFIREDGKIQIPMSEKLGQCDIYMTTYYQWNGDWFEPVDLSFELLKDGFNSLKDCYYNFPYEADQVETSEAIQIMDEAIKIYSPGSAEEKDILEEFRVKKGLIYLFSGKPDQAREVFEEITNTPLKQDGIWVTPVQNFLKIYQEPSDLYRACTALTVCDPNRAGMITDSPNCAMFNPCQAQALEYVMSSQSRSGVSLEDFTSNLRDAGIEVASEGRIDLDYDGKNELWFTIAPPTHLYYELWFVSDYPGDLQAFRAATYPTSAPEFDLKPVSKKGSLISVGNPQNLFWTRDATTNQPSLLGLYEWQNPEDIFKYPTIYEDLKEFEQIQSQFRLSDHPENIYEDFLKVANRYDSCPYQLRSPDMNFYKFECGNYYYAIGFFAELAKDNQTAEQMYRILVEKYPESPLTLLAQKKLEQ